jgi:hypothetical protein
MKVQGQPELRGKTLSQKKKKQTKPKKVKKRRKTAILLT